MLLNLLNNAVKFTDAGEVVVRVESVFGGADNALGTEQLRIIVRDTGIRIPQDKIHDLFESFSQVDAGRRPGDSGALASVGNQPTAR